MPGFSWKKASHLLTPTEKDRICCLLLTCIEQIKPNGEDFRLAASEFGAASGGFTKMYQTTIKKLRDANAYAGSGNDEDENDTAPETSKTTTTPHKRKAATNGDKNGESPTKKPRTPKKTKSEVKVKAEDNEDEVTEHGSVQPTEEV